MQAGRVNPLTMRDAQLNLYWFGLLSCLPRWGGGVRCAWGGFTVNTSSKLGDPKNYTERQKKRHFSMFRSDTKIADFVFGCYWGLRALPISLGANISIRGSHAAAQGYNVFGIA